MTHAPPQQSAPYETGGYEIMHGAHMPPSQRFAALANNFLVFIHRGFFLIVAAFVMEIFAPEDYRPSTVIGRFQGNVDKHEMDIKREAHVQTQQQLALATATADMIKEQNAQSEARKTAANQVGLDMELIALEARQKAVLAGSFGKMVGGGFSDLLCVAGGSKAGDPTCRTAARVRESTIAELDALAQASLGSIHARIMSQLPDSPERTKLLQDATLAIVGQTKAVSAQVSAALPKSEYTPPGVVPGYTTPPPGKNYAPSTLEGQFENGLY
jgi:hypothetical protein